MQGLRFRLEADYTPGRAGGGMRRAQYTLTRAMWDNTAALPSS